MPQQRRSSAARADTRPSFARPPGAKAVPQTPSPAAARRHYRRDLSDDESDSDDESRSPSPVRRSTPKRATKETKAKASPATSPVKKHAHGRPLDTSRHKRKISEPPRAYDRGDKHRDRAKYNSGTSTGSASQLLSADAIAKLNAKNEQAEFEERRQAKKRKEKQYKNIKTIETTQQKRKKKNRNVSGAILEEGRAGGGGGGGGKGRRKHGGGHDQYNEKYYSRKHSPRRKRWWILGAVSVILLIIIIVAVVVSNKNKGQGGDDSSSNSGAGPTIKNDCDSSGVPTTAKGTYTDISTWLDTTDFNCTYTDETVGGLSVMGLKSDWDDSAQANGNVPALNKPWQYGKMPIRGTNVGGWLNLEPFITPSFFNYPATDNVVDEWSLSRKLGPAASRTLENHYATYITKSDFQQIADAGLDHVRIPFGYWAVKTYDGDPYVSQISWRYLLRAIEWCREYGLRVNLDPHAMPGSQNGWAHSGHQGAIEWLNGANGDANGQRSLDIHDQLSKFFAQDRYKNVVTIYGLVNEPKMISIQNPDNVLNWNRQAISLVRKNGIDKQIVFGDGFLALTEWNDMFKDVDDKLMLDTHQYQIFNTGQLKLKHSDKINLACSGWTGIMVTSNNPKTGWGPTVNGEWSQADTDCTPNLNNVGVGSRWAGTLSYNNPFFGDDVTTPTCASPPCTCGPANADPSTYSASYKKFLQMYAEAQMHSFEQAQGWFYWTWKTESAVQWSWKLGLKAGILPKKAYQPSFKCDGTVPDFNDLGDSY